MESKSLAQLKIALLCKQIIDSKWYQFRTRAKLYREAKVLAKKWDIDL